MTNTYHGACLGNWQEEQFSIAADLAEFQRRRANGELLLTKLHAKMAAACAPVPLTPAHTDFFLRFGDTVTVHSVLTGTVLAVNMEKQVVGEQIAYQVSGSADPTPVGRTAFTVLRPGGGADAADGGVVLHAQPVVLALRGYKGAPLLLLQTQKLALPGLSQSSSSKKDDVCAVTAESKANLWKFIAAEAGEQLVAEGTPVRVNTSVALQHVPSGLLLCTDFVKLRNLFGAESDVHAALSRATRLGGMALPKVFLEVFVPDASKWTLHAGEPLEQTMLVKGTADLAAEPPRPGRLAFLRGHPFYARLVADAMAATGVPEQAIALQRMAYGPGGSLSALAGGPLGAPGVLIVGDGWQASAQASAQAAALAASGYRVLLPELQQEADGGEDGPDFGGALQALAHGAAHLKAEGAPSVGALGFSLGAALVLGAAAQIADVECAAFCYGVDGGLFALEELLAKPLQGHFGREDAEAGFSDAPTAAALQRALGEAGARAEICVYEGAGHLFLNDAPHPHGSFEEREAQTGLRPFDARNAEQAWGRILAFFAAKLAR